MTARDLIESRQDWITHFGLCEYKVLRLRQWYESQPQPQPEAVQPQSSVNAHDAIV